MACGVDAGVASSDTRTTYPWGSVAPRAYLRVVCARVTQALDDAKSPGFGHVSPRVRTAVRATRPLVDALRHLSEKGLRSTPGADPLAPAEVLGAIDAVDRAVNGLAAASALVLSERYRAFSEAVCALLAMVEQCAHRGIAPPTAEPVPDGWAVFEP